MRREREQKQPPKPPDMMMWAANLAHAGQQMDRHWQSLKTGSRVGNAPPSGVEVNTNAEYPFGHGGVFRIPGDGAT